MLYGSLGLGQPFDIWLQLVMLRPPVAFLLPPRESVSNLAYSSVAGEGIQTASSALACQAGSLAVGLRSRFFQEQ